MKSLAEHIEMRQRFMADQRLLQENAWQEIVDLFMPFRGDITTDRTEGSKRIESVLDSVGMEAADSFANFVHGNVFSGRWFRLVALNRDGSINEDAQRVTDLTAERMYTALDGSNFYPQAFEFLRDMSVLGTGIMRVRDFDDLVFESVFIKEAFILENHKKQIDTVHWEFCLTAEQAAERFGIEKIGPDVMKMINSGCGMHELRFLQATFPRRKEIPWTLDAGSKGKPWASVILMEPQGGGERRIVEESGFRHNPYVVGRWMQLAGELWGRGVGHKVRPDMKGTNEIKRNILLAIPMSLRPVLAVADDGVMNTDIIPGGMLTVRPGPLQPNYINPGSDYAAADSVRREDHKIIRSAFLGDVLNEPDTEPRSAAETLARQQRALRRLAAPASRVEREFLIPSATLIFETMLDSGKLPEMRELLGASDVSIDLQIVSPMLLAQRESSLVPLQQSIVEDLNMAQATGDPRWLDKWDPDGVGMVIRKARSIHAAAYRLEEQVAQMREARAAQAAQAQMLAAVETASKAGGVKSAA